MTTIIIIIIILLLLHYFTTVDIIVTAMVLDIRMDTAKPTNTRLGRFVQYLHFGPKQKGVHQKLKPEYAS